MLSLLGLNVNEALFEHWSQLLVCDYAPYFLSCDLAKRLKADVFVLERAEYRQFCLSQSHSDSYTPYSVDSSGEFICLLSAKEIAQLSPLNRTALLKAQVDLGRGQVYRWDDVKTFLKDCPQAEAWRIDEDFVLDYSIWHTRAASARRDWLCHFIAEEQMICLSQQLTDEEWRAIGGDKIKNFLGWERQSGANCFASALAMASQKYEIGRLWLHQAAFFRGLSELGYQRQDNTDFSLAQLKNAVLVWEDETGLAQHSAYLLAEQILVNKDSQCWFSPRQLVRLNDLLLHWQDEGYKLTVYIRN